MKPLRYVGLALIACFGLYQVMQLNRASDVIADMNREHKEQRIEAKKRAEKLREENYAMDDYKVSEPSDLSDSSADEPEYSAED